MFSFKGFASFEKLPEKLHIYTGVFLKEEDRAKLLKAFPPRHPNVYADHVTFWFRPDLDQVRKIYAENSPTTQELLMRVIGYASDEKAEAVVIEFPWADLSGLVIKNEIMHITLSCADGVSPAYSNELLKTENAKVYEGARRDWNPLIFVGQLGVCSHSDRTYLPQGMWKRRGL